MRRLPVVGVMGSGSEAHEPDASRIGRWLAEEGVHLLTGGGGGVMAAVSEMELAKQYRRPIAVFAPGDDFDALQAFVRKILAKR